MWDSEESKSTDVGVVKEEQGGSWRKSFRERNERTRDYSIRLEREAKEYEQTKREPDQVHIAVIEYAYKSSHHDMRAPTDVLREDVWERKELVTGEQVSSLLLEWLLAEGYSQDHVKGLLDALTPKQREFLWKSIVRDLEMRNSRMHRSQQENREDVSRQDIVIKDQGSNTYTVEVKNARDTVKGTVSSPSIHEGAFVPYDKGLTTEGKDMADVDERYASLLSVYTDAYGHLERKYAQLLDALIRTPSPTSQSVSPLSFEEVVRKEGSGSPPVASEQSSVGANAVVRIEIDEDSLTVEQMGVLFSTLSSLATKYWLISQGRFADLIEFTKSHDERFVREAQAVITRISYNSPLNFDIKLSATDAAQGMVTTIDGIVQGKQRLKQMELATQTKESELHQAELRFAEELKQLQQQEAFEQGKRQLELERQQLELERLRLEVAQQRLGFLEARLEMQSKSLDHAFEIAQRVISQLHPQADEATKRMLVQTYVGDILQLTEVSFTSVTVVEVDQAPPINNKDKEQ